MAAGKDAGNAVCKYIGKSTVALFVVLVILLSMSVGSTVAWLTAKTDSVKNTFTYGDISITLEETDTNRDNDDNPNTNQYTMLSGGIIDKDPKITVEKGSESCWLFVKLEKSASFDDFLSYEISEGWNPLFDTNNHRIEGVFFRVVDANEVENADKEFFVIRDNQVAVLESVTEAQLNELSGADSSEYPKLNITAYAVQRDSMLDAVDTALEAWELTKN